MCRLLVVHRKNDFIDLHAYVVYVHVNVNVAATLDERTHQTHHNKEQMAKVKGGESKLFCVLFEKMRDVIFVPIMSTLCNNEFLFSIKDYPQPPPLNDIKGDRDAIRRHLNKVQAKIYRDRIKDSVFGPL